MKIEFLSTTEEKVDVALRYLELSGRLRRGKWQGLIHAPILSGLVFLLISGSVTYRIIYASIIGVACIVWHLSTYRRKLEKRIQKALVKDLGTDDSTPTEYEINEDGIVIKELGSETSRPWSSLREVRETEDALEFIHATTGISIIPRRAFRDETEFKQWVDYANARVGRVKQGAPGGASEPHA